MKSKIGIVVMLLVLSNSSTYAQMKLANPLANHLGECVKQKQTVDTTYDVEDGFAVMRIKKETIKTFVSKNQYFIAAKGDTRVVKLFSIPDTSIRLSVYGIQALVRGEKPLVKTRIKIGWFSFFGEMETFGKEYSLDDKNSLKVSEEKKIQGQEGFVEISWKAFLTVLAFVATFSLVIMSFSHLRCPFLKSVELLFSVVMIGFIQVTIYVLFKISLIDSTYLKFALLPSTMVVIVELLLALIVYRVKKKFNKQVA